MYDFGKVSIPAGIAADGLHGFAGFFLIRKKDQIRLAHFLTSMPPMPLALLAAP
jgi:hypothetical protein